MYVRLPDNSNMHKKIPTAHPQIQCLEHHAQYSIISTSQTQKFIQCHLLIEYENSIIPVEFETVYLGNKWSNLIFKSQNFPQPFLYYRGKRKQPQRVASRSCVKHHTGKVHSLDKSAIYYNIKILIIAGNNIVVY